MKLARVGAAFASVAFVLAAVGPQAVSAGARVGPRADGAAQAGSAQAPAGKTVHMHVFAKEPHHPVPEGDEEEKVPTTPIDKHEHLLHGPPIRKPTLPGPAANAATGAHPAAGSDFAAFVDSAPTSSASLISEPSIATSDPYVLMTWNWGAAVSSDGGAHWSYLDPYTQFPASFGGFCCDQVAIYDSSHNLFIWILQYSTDSSSNNAIRVAVANGGYNMTHGIFTYWDLTPQQLGSPSGTNYDQPKAGLTSSNLWMEITQYGGAGSSVVLKIPLSSLAAGGSLPYSFWGANLFSPGLVGQAGATMYFASHVDTNTIRVFHWDDSSGTIFWNDIDHTAYPLNYPYSCPRTGGSSTSDWCQRRSFGGGYAHGDRIFYGQLVGNIVSFQWDASQGTGGFGTFSYPYVQGVRVDINTMTLSSQDTVFNQSFAWQYAALAPDGRGDLGGSLMFGGGSYYEGCSTLLHDQYTSGSWEADYSYYGSYDTTDTLSGDYLTARSQGNTWSATCYLPQSSGSSMTAHYFRFGRQADTPLRTLTAYASGPGTIYSFPNYEINCTSSVCAASFVQFTTVNLYASANPGYTFTGWDFDCFGYGTTQPCPVYMSQDRSAFAGFADQTAPTKPKFSLPSDKFTTQSKIPVAWSASDSGSGVYSYDVQVRSAPYNGGFGAFGPWLTGTTSTSGLYNAALGKTYCFEARARDAASNVSAYSNGKKCTAVPVDDPTLSVGVGSWTRHTGAGKNFKKTYSEATAKNATLTLAGVHAKRLALLVQTCPTCGSVSVLFNGTSIATFNLTSASLTKQVLLTIPAFSSVKTGTVTIKVTSTGKKVDIDGLGVSAV